MPVEVIGIDHLYLAVRDLAASERFFDRESSWLDFNTRVLSLAEDVEIPLLERVRFAAILTLVAFSC